MKRGAGTGRLNGSGAAAPPERLAARPAEAAARARATARLLGLGTATPALCWSQEQIAEAMIEQWGLRGSTASRFRRLSAACAIEQRHAVLPPAQILPMTTMQRMEAYERHAPQLALDAARRALEAANVAPAEITDLVTVSCTGFTAPGLDVELVQRLGLPVHVRRSCIGFMGCFGAIIGLRSAVAACSADPAARVLVVCLELCSLHLRNDRGMENQVASALFADGAAAAVLAGEWATVGGAERGAAAPIGSVTLGAARLLLEGRDWMSWRVTDAGFAMTLSRRVPEALREHLAPLVAGLDEPPPRTWVIHPGGPEILDAADDALNLRGARGIDHAREILRCCGNMSSATVLFVLERALAADAPLPALLMAFGPGLAIECVSVL